MRRVLLSVLFSVLSVAAFAQEPSRYPGLGNGDTTPGTPSLPQDIELTVAAGVGIAPEFMGAGDYEAVFTPAIRMEYKQKAFLVIDRTAMMVPYEGLGYKMLSGQDWSVGMNLTYDKGRSDNSDRIRGMGDIDWTAVGGVFAAYHPGPFFVRGQVGYDLLNEFDGYKGELGAGVVAPLTSSVRGMLEVDAAFAGDGYNEAYFGVDATQSAATGLTAYNGDPGFYRMGISGALLYQMTQGAFIEGIARYDVLMNSAKESPISEDNGQFYLGGNVGYRF